MKKTPIRLSVAALTLLLALPSQSAPPSRARQSYEDFRREVIAGYNSYRDDIMKRYADFLNTPWEKHETQKPEPLYREPKPKQPPVAPSTLPEKSVVLPAPVAPSPISEAEAAPEHKPTNSPSAVNNSDESPTVIDFYGMEIPVPKPTVRIQTRLYDERDFAMQWKTLEASDDARNLAGLLQHKTEELQLNDYLALDFIKTYVAQCFPDIHSSSRYSLIHYIWKSLGHEARIATCDGEGVLLVPSIQTIYSHPRVGINESPYNAFSDINDQLLSKQVATCRLPEEATQGQPLDLRINRMPRLPEQIHEFNISSDGITLTGQINENLFPLLYHYPLTDMNVYASSVINKSLRDSLVSQIKTQLQGMPTLDAVNTLLSFTQNAVNYSTDDAFHGFEKPYFLEEWLYYPLNDCEDRAIFYTYMLWHALGVECHLLSYPAHESAAVRLDAPIKGDCYISNGSTFFISDPTFQGAKTGNCMPTYQKTTPKIDFHYK